MATGRGGAVSTGEPRTSAARRHSDRFNNNTHRMLFDVTASPTRASAQPSVRIRWAICPSASRGRRTRT
eukprot:4385701-Pyramimonas_sp.AAC.1